jgi:N-acetylglucosamine-6-phosphate deacetylase
MIANSLASPEGSILTSNGWVTGKVEFAGHAISVIDGRTLAPGAKPKGPFVLPGFIDLHVHGGGGGDWQGGEEGVRTFVRYHTSLWEASGLMERVSRPLFNRPRPRTRPRTRSLI